MSNNQIGMVRTQFKTRGYIVDEVEVDDLGHSVFTVESDRHGKPVAVTLTHIPSAANPGGDQWLPENIHWGTDTTTYAGTTERSAAELADTILKTVAADNSR
jgi:hypothetical protein